MDVLESPPFISSPSARRDEERGEVAEPTAPPLYPKLPNDGPNELNAENFRLNKINLILAHLESQTKHYEQVRKKYAKARSVLNKISVTTGTLSVLLAGSGTVTSFTGPGVLVGLPLATVGIVCGGISAGCAAIVSSLSKKVSKHDKEIMLAKSKANSVADLVSKALKDRVISDEEFSVILKEADKYEKMKNEITHKSVVVRDLTEAQKKEIYAQARADIRKQIGIE